MKIHGSEKDDERVTCNIIEYPLESNIAFEAISYTWQDQVPSDLVLCDGQEHLITANCHAALRRFRPSTSDAARYVWIDQICIDQELAAQKEKSAQVATMDKIYGLATKVLVFLLPEDLQNANARAELQAQNLRAVGWLANLATAVQEPIARNQQRKYAWLADTAPVQGSLVGYIPCCRLTYPDILAFARDIPWFKRLWCDVLDERSLIRPGEGCGGLLGEAVSASMGAKSKSRCEGLRLLASILLPFHTMHRQLQE